MNQIKKTILPNGIKIITETLPNIKSFSLGFWFEVGSRDENFSNNGITHFIEHMFFKGTKKRSAKKIVTEIEACGGYLNAFTSKEHTCYYGRGLVEHFSNTFDVISDMILNSVFRDNDIKKESGVIIDEIRDVEDNPEELIFDKFEELLFTSSSLSYPILGNENNIKNFNRTDFLKYIKEKYSFSKMLIVSSGGIEHNQVIKLAEKYFGNGSENPNFHRKYFTRQKRKSSVSFLEKDIHQIHAIIGTSTYGYKSKKRIHASLLSQILGEGSSSRLFQTLRERNGITYQVHSFLNSFFDTSVFGIYFSTNEKMINKAIALAEREILKLKLAQVPKGELQKAKEAMKGTIILSMENTSNRMIRLAQTELYYRRFKTLEETISEINSVSEKQIHELADEILDLNYLQKLFIKPLKININC